MYTQINVALGSIESPAFRFCFLTLCLCCLVTSVHSWRLHAACTRTKKFQHINRAQLLSSFYFFFTSYSFSYFHFWSENLKIKEWMKNSTRNDRGEQGLSPDAFLIYPHRSLFLFVFSTSIQSRLPGAACTLYNTPDNNRHKQRYDVKREEMMKRVARNSSSRRRERKKNRERMQ